MSQVSDYLLPADPEGDAQLAGMLKRQKHTRECHIVGHRGCDNEKCRARCQECKAESLIVWDRKKYALSKAADLYLKHGELIQAITAAVVKALGEI